MNKKSLEQYVIDSVFTLKEDGNFKIYHCKLCPKRFGFTAPEQSIVLHALLHYIGIETRQWIESALNKRNTLA